MGRGRRRCNVYHWSRRNITDTLRNKNGLKLLFNLFRKRFLRNVHDTFHNLFLSCIIHDWRSRNINDLLLSLLLDSLKNL